MNICGKIATFAKPRNVSGNNMRTIIILIFTSFISCSNIDEAKKENYNYIISTQRFGCRESIVFCIKDYIEINNNAAIKIAIANDEFDDYDFYELKPNAETLKELINNMNDSTSFIYPDKDITAMNFR